MKLVLASASPRRRELLDQVGLAHAVKPQDVDESVLPGETPEDYVLRVASKKADACPRQPDEVVLAADTTVVADGQILGKPADHARAREMLLRLSGTSHVVLSAVAARSERGGFEALVRAIVTLRRLSDREIDAYLATGESFDKAGAYGVQGIAGTFVERVDGSYTAVVGLPLAETELLLQRAGLDTWALRLAGLRA
ncbi:MAG: Maf family protein [Pseudomonadaceae bacterium]|nr:Maf family protein [Pseudomonadaceae bacterium]